MPGSQRSSLLRNIVTVRRSLRAFQRALAQLALGLKGEAVRRAEPASKRHRKLKLSPARRRALELHSTYMDHLRQLGPHAEAEVGR